MGVPSRAGAPTPTLIRLAWHQILLGRHARFTSPRRGPSIGSDHCSRDRRTEPIPPAAAMISTIPARRSAATPYRPNTTNTAGLSVARPGPAADARPVEPPTAQNRCTAAKAAHHAAAPTAGKLHEVARASTDQERPPSGHRSDSRWCTGAVSGRAGRPPPAALDRPAPLGHSADRRSPSARLPPVR